MKARILERWDMEFKEPSPGDEPWWLGWAIRSPKEASSHITSAWHAYSSLVPLNLPITSAVEYFGGTGAHSLIISDLFNPAVQFAQDYSHQAAEHLRRELSQITFGRQADSYDPNNGTVNGDLVGLDFGDLTAFRTRHGEKQRALIDQVFNSRPHAVVITDIACRYMHLHRVRYEAVLGPGKCQNYETYLYALAAHLSAISGLRYNLVSGYWTRWSAVLAFAYNHQGDPRIYPTPKGPRGLEWI